MFQRTFGSSVVIALVIVRTYYCVCTQSVSEMSGGGEAICLLMRLVRLTQSRFQKVGWRSFCDYGLEE